jgi:hypothetical protein
MGYIRTNEDYYASLGMSPERAALEVELDKARIDYGVCNPRKAKLAAEQEAEIRARLKKDSR